MNKFLTKTQILKTIYKEYNDLTTIESLGLKNSKDTQIYYQYEDTYDVVMYVERIPNYFRMIEISLTYPNFIGNETYEFYMDKIFLDYFKKERQMIYHISNLFNKMNPIAKKFSKRTDVTKEELVLYCQNYRLIS